MVFLGIASCYVCTMNKYNYYRQQNNSLLFIYIAHYIFIFILILLLILTKI